MHGRRLNFRPIYVALLALTMLVVLAITAKVSGLALNFTASMPDVVYRVGHGEKGSIAVLCAPIPHTSIGHGPCPDGSMPLLKRVVAVEGDEVRVTDYGVEVNGKAVPNSKPLDLASNGRALPHLRGIFLLKSGETWVAGEHPNSFDSRYFGPAKIHPRSTPDPFDIISRPLPLSEPGP